MEHGRDHQNHGVANDLHRGCRNVNHRDEPNGRHVGRHVGHHVGLHDGHCCGGHHLEHQRVDLDEVQKADQIQRLGEDYLSDLRSGNQNVNRPVNLDDDQNWGVQAFSQGYEQIADFVANETRECKRPSLTRQ